MFFLLVSNIFFSQIVQPSLLISAGSQGTDYSSGIDLDSEQNVYACGLIGGYIPQFGTITLNDVLLDAFIAKYSPSGNIVWVRKIGGRSDDRALDIKVKDNALYLCGVFSDSINFSNDNSWEDTVFYSNGNQDIFVTKYDLDGNLLWARSFGGLSSDYNAKLKVSDEGVYVSATVIDSVNFMQPPSWQDEILYSNGTTDGILVKYSLEGERQWAKRLGGEGEIRTVCNDIAIDNTHVYIAGNFDGTINFNTPSASGSNELETQGLNDAFIAKYTQDGTFVWAKRAGGFEDDNASSLTIYNNEIYLTGLFSTTANFNTPWAVGTNELSTYSSFYKELFLVKMDLEGSVILKTASKSLGESKSGKAIEVNENGVYIAGFFDGNLCFNEYPCSENGGVIAGSDLDVFIAKYDQELNYLWSRRGGGGGGDDDAGYDIALSYNGFLVSGKYSGTANFNTPSQSGSNEITEINSTDIFIVKYWETNVGIEEKQENEIVLFPNPANTTLKIILEGNSNKSIHLVNLLGTKVLEINTKEENPTINIEKLTKGMYFLLIETENESFKGSFVKE